MFYQKVMKTHMLETKSTRCREIQKIAEALNRGSSLVLGLKETVVKIKYMEVSRIVFLKTTHD